MSNAYALATTEHRVVVHTSPKQLIIDLLADFSIELTPTTAAKHESIASLLPEGTQVYIAYLPGESHLPVVETAIRLRREGLVPVPHLPARTLGSHAQLEDYLGRVTGEAGVEQMLVIGGGIDLPVGPFPSTQALLETGRLEAHGVRAIGLAGHPEGQRELPPPGAATSLEQKLAYADRSPAAFHFATQFVFEAGPVLTWERAIRGAGNQLPIHVGIPGPATVKSLLSYARLCGVGNSMRVLTRQAGNLFKLTNLAYPDRSLVALSEARARDPESRIARLHFYPFGGLARTTRWLRAVQDGAFTMNRDGRGFTVQAD